MVWEKDGTLLEETHGGIVHDGSEVSNIYMNIALDSTEGMNVLYS